MADASADPLTALYVYQAGRYVAFGCLALCMWDWLLAFSQEYDMVCKSLRGKRWSRSMLMIAVYFVCRASSFAYIVADVVIEAVPLSSCDGIARTIGVLNTITTPATAFLFLVRLNAIYLDCRAAVAFFSLCWVALLGCYVYDSILATLNIRYIPSAHMCGLTLDGPSDASSFLSIASFDTIVYVAISWRLAASSRTGGNWRGHLKSFISGSGLYRFSRTLLRDGQLYYFTTVGMSITIAYFAAGPGASSDWAGQFTPLGIAIPTVMGCRVFRELKLGIIQDAMTMPDSLTVSTAVFANEPQREHAWTVGGLSDSASELELMDIGKQV